jgi:hypothetical protein
MVNEEGSAGPEWTALHHGEEKLECQTVFEVGKQYLFLKLSIL